MTAYLTHFLFEFRTGIRNKTLLIMNYLLPLGFYLMIGTIMGGIMPDFGKTMIPAMVVFSILSATLLGIPDPLVNARENGIFRTYKINGIPALSILIIPALTTMLHMVIATIFITVTAPIFFNAVIPANWFNYVLVFVVFSFACAGLSILIGVISPNSRVTVLWSQLFFIPSNILGGMMLPYSILPEAAKKVAQLLPPTQAMNAFNGLAMGNPVEFSAWGSVLVLFIGGLLSFGLALYLFSWDNRNTERRGNIAMALLIFLPYIASIFLS